VKESFLVFRNSYVSGASLIGASDAMCGSEDRGMPPSPNLTGSHDRDDSSPHRCSAPRRRLLMLFKEKDRFGKNALPCSSNLCMIRPVRINNPDISSPGMDLAADTAQLP
jgi:hypothetical protein